MTTTMQGGEWAVVERVIPEPRAGHVRVKVDACGMCHSDVLVNEGLWPGRAYPRVPGHEIAGHLDAVGDHVTAWHTGQRVGVGWQGGLCVVCERCRRGDFAMCVHRQVTGVDCDGGYAEYLIARAETLVALPDALPAEDAGPLCVRASRSPTRSAMLARAPEKLSPCTASADSGLSACRTRGRWALRRSRSTGEATRSPWRGNWARIMTLMRSRKRR
jgi:hypothetical protein